MDVKRRIEVIGTMQKKSMGGGSGREFRVQVGCEQGIEFIVKLQKKSRGGGGSGRGGPVRGV